MLTTLLAIGITILAVTVPPVEDAGAEKKPEKKKLFADERWYKAQDGKEQPYIGVLQKIDRGAGVVGFGRFNPYRLVMEQKGKKDIREVYVGAKVQLLAPYVGKTVKLTGRPVELEVEGQHHREIWPGWIEVLPAQAPEKKHSRAARPVK